MGPWGSVSEPCRAASDVVDVRVRGAVGVVEFDRLVDVGGLCQRFADAGCWIRPMGKTIYLAPPFTTSDAELEVLTGAISAEVATGGD
jgi:adenosylmethionine-8-amino-7-oxononanoate aminotransferase